MLTLAIVIVGARLVILGIELIIRTRRANSMGCGQEIAAGQISGTRPR
jgi:hypothetical protein